MEKVAKKAMTIEEIKELKTKTEKEILKLIINYEAKTETRVRHISVNSDTGDDTWNVPANKIKMRKSRGVLDVTMETTMDNDVRSIDK